MYMTSPIDNTQTIRGEAAAAMTDPAMLAVKFDTNGKLAVPGAGDFCIGIALADSVKVAAGDPLHVQIKDIGYWMAGATITKGSLLKTDATGKAVTAAAGDAVLAVALEAGTSGKPMKVLICHTLIKSAT